MLEPHYRLGQEAVRLLQDRVLRSGRSLPSVTIDFIWLNMDTCAPPRETARV